MPLHTHTLLPRFPQVDEDVVRMEVDEPAAQPYRCPCQVVGAELRLQRRFIQQIAGLEKGRK
jgi:hypothetical protein